MINFRFHIISLVAVFLALALGVLFGSAVGEPAIVDTLHGQINTAQNRLHDLRQENSDLNAEMKRLSDFVDATGPLMVQDRLQGVDVAVLAERGVDGKPVHDTMQLLHDAGANAPVAIWLEPRWQLPERADVDALATAIGSSSTIPDTVRVEAMNALARRVSRPASTVEGTPDLLTTLADAKFISIDGADAKALASFPAHRGRAVVIDGSRSDITDPAVFVAAVAAFKNRGVPTVAAEVGSEAADERSNRGQVVDVVRADDQLDGEVSTLDDLDLAQGRLTAVLALQQAASGVFRDYGYG